VPTQTQVSAPATGNDSLFARSTTRPSSPGVHPVGSRWLPCSRAKQALIRRGPLDLSGERKRVFVGLLLLAAGRRVLSGG
jgi:hypothetical protein